MTIQKTFTVEMPFTVNVIFAVSHQGLQFNNHFKDHNIENNYLI